MALAYANKCFVFTVQDEGWTIVPGVVHAPGPWLILEMQRAQDDFNLVSFMNHDALSARSLNNICSDCCVLVSIH